MGFEGEGGLTSSNGELVQLRERALHRQREMEAGRGIERERKTVREREI